LPNVEPKITTQKLQKAREQQQVLKELLGHIPAGNPFYLGFFYTSNSIAFNATIKETNALSAVDLAALKQAIEDLLVITSSPKKNLKNLAELGISLHEILEDIERYDSISG
jgi:hypothetical protein